MVVVSMVTLAETSCGGREDGEAEEVEAEVVSAWSEVGTISTSGAPVCLDGLKKAKPRIKKRSCAMLLVFLLPFSRSFALSDRGVPHHKGLLW